MILNTENDLNKQKLKKYEKSTFLFYCINKVLKKGYIKCIDLKWEMPLLYITSIISCNAIVTLELHCIVALCISTKE